jgi:hypothetical protein
MDWREIRATPEWTFRVRLAPHERSGGLGVSPHLNALVFETEEGEWVGSVGVYPTVRLEELSDAELLDLLDQAISTG